MLAAKGLFIKVGKLIGRGAKVALSLFVVQFLGAIVYFYYEIQQSLEILGGPVTRVSNDLITYHYFKMVLLSPIVGLSVIFTLAGFVTKWEFDFEQEVIEVFIFISWLILGLLSLFGPTA